MTLHVRIQRGCRLIAEDQTSRSVLPNSVIRGLKKLCHYWEISRQRRQLAELSDEALWDIGISRADALQESRKPFWK